MSSKLEYQIVGRYMNGAEVTGYHMLCNNGKTERYTRDQVCFLVGRGQVVNCDGQLYQDKVLLRGKGISLDSLPVISEKDGSLSRTDNLGNIRKGTEAKEALSNLMIVKTIMRGRNNIGYVVRTAGGVDHNISRNDAFKLASEGKIGNASVQNCNGQVLLRGAKGYNLGSLPVIQAE